MTKQYSSIFTKELRYMKIENIIFDFNGTIIDDVDCCLLLLNKLLDTRNHPPINKKRYKDIFRFPIIEYYKLAGFNFKNNQDNYQELAQMFQDEYHKCCNNCSLYPHLEESLKRYFPTKRLIVLSATVTAELKKQLAHYGIDKYFQDILGIDSIYVEGKIDVAKQFMSNSKIDPQQTVVIGDTDHDYEVAKAIECHSILFSQGHQSRKTLEKCSPDYVIDDYKELWNIIK